MLHVPKHMCLKQSAMIVATVQIRRLMQEDLDSGFYSKQRMPTGPAGLCCCKNTYGDLLLIQVCSGPTPVQCHTAFGKLQCPLLSAALQNRLIAGLCYCKYSYGDLLLIQVCSGSTPVQCDTAFGKMQCSLLIAAVQKRLAATLFCCKNTYGDLPFIQGCSGPTPVQCDTAFGKIELPRAQ